MGRGDRCRAEVCLAVRPDSAMDWRNAGPASFAYADNCLVDVHSAIIVDVEASRAVRVAGFFALNLDHEAARSGTPSDNRGC